MTNQVNRANADRPGSDGSYSEILRQIEDGGFCPFCPENLHIHHTNPVFLEADNWRATDNFRPYQHAAEHVLIIHRNHIETLDELSQDAWDELKVVINSVLKLKEMRGSTMVFRSGETKYTGATVSHLHLNLVRGSGEVGSEPVLTRVG